MAPAARTDPPPPAIAGGGEPIGSRTTAAERRTEVSERVAWIALILVLLIPIWWGVDPRFSWDVDHIAPGSVLKAMAARFGPEWYSSYGPVPYVVTAIAYLPALIVFRLTGELGDPSPEYPWGFQHPEASIGVLVIVARLVTLLLALGTVWLGTRALRRFAGPLPGWVTPVLFLGSPVFVYYARTSNVDLHVLFWLFLAFDLAETARGPLRLALAGAAAALAVCCKEQVAPLAVVAAILALWRAWRDPAARGGGHLATLLAVPIGSLIAYALVWRLPFAWPGWVEHHRFLFDRALYPRTFAPTPGGILALAQRCLGYMPLTFGLPILAGVVLALLARPPWRGLWTRTLACVLYLATFIASIGYVYPRFLLPLLVLALPLAGRTFAVLHTALASRPARLRLAGVGLIVLSLAGGPALSWVMLDDPRLAAERWLERHRAAGGEVEVAGNPHYQARVPRGFRVLHTEPDRLADRPRAPHGALVLISSIDSYRFQMDPAVRGRWWEPLHASGGEYRRAAEFETGPLGWLVYGLPVAPTVTIFERLAGAGPPPPLDPVEFERGDDQPSGEAGR
jgi:hypothetical protein